jgi:ubiquinone/menaquinone biosynthesis C-methylase UbiE
MSRLIETLLGRILTFFFYHLYHRFAFTYDLVSSIVSMGHWKEWVFHTIPYLAGPSILELGHGPGHLLKKLRSDGFSVYGLDESRQMGLAAKKNILKNRERSIQKQSINLIRGKAEKLPFKSQSFNSVVATFPPAFILDEKTLTEVNRVLKSDGFIVVLLSVWIVGGRHYDKLLAGLYKLTHESPDSNNLDRFLIPFEKAGFNSSLKVETFQSARLLFLFAKKQGRDP